jgi:hypothetical protein
MAWAKPKSPADKESQKRRSQKRDAATGQPKYLPGYQGIGQLPLKIDFNISCHNLL